MSESREASYTSIRQEMVSYLLFQFSQVKMIKYGAVKMESYLQACDLWDLVEVDPEDPPIAHMRNNRDERKRRYI